MLAGHQPTLLGSQPAAPAPATWSRIELGHGAWIEVAREWWAGGDTLLAQLVATVPWRRGRRRMWDRVVDDPRLSHWCGRDEEHHPALVAMQRRLEARYRRRLRPPGLNYYRDGRDSVAWHADRELRDLDDTIVAIVTLGARRPFLVRPAGGGASRDLAPASGDVVVMGGSTQRDWEHCVPKTARAGPRVSVSWRWTPAPRRTAAGAAGEPTSDG